MKSLRHWLLERLVARRPRLALELASAPLRISGLEVRLPPRSPLFRALGGEFIAMPLDDTIAPYVLDHGCWQPDEVDFIAQHKPDGPSVLVDVGANIGLMTRQLLHRVPDIGAAMCFEPHPGNFEYLQRNLAHLPQCRLTRAALGVQAGELRFYEDENNSGNHSLNPDAVRGARVRTTVVTCLAATEAAVLGVLPPALAAAPIIWKSDTQGFDEAIMTALPDSFWARVQVGVMEMWQIDRPSFDLARLGEILARFELLRYADQPQRNLSVKEILEFAAGRQGAQKDLYFARARPV